MQTGPGHAVLGKGFDDPVPDAQRCFRLILAAMSEPGSIHRLEPSIEAPDGIEPAAVRVLLTLADNEAAVWISPELSGAAAPYVRFHCGAPVAETPLAARFAVMPGSSAMPGLAAFDPGCDRYPDRSATLIVQCRALQGGVEVALAGPGIQGVRSIAPLGLHAGFWREAAANHSRYPLGVDLILVAGDELLCIPRSTRIDLVEAR